MYWDAAKRRKLSFWFQFTSGWYDGLDDAFNRMHLRNIEQDIRQLVANKENIPDNHGTDYND